MTNTRIFPAIVLSISVVSYFCLYSQKYILQLCCLDLVTTVSWVLAAAAVTTALPVVDAAAGAATTPLR